MASWKTFTGDQFSGINPGSCYCEWNPIEDDSCDSYEHESGFTTLKMDVRRPRFDWDIGHVGNFWCNEYGSFTVAIEEEDFCPLLCANEGFWSAKEHFNTNSG
jgi:hypothetical protein